MPGVTTKIVAIVLVTCSVFALACGTALIGNNSLTAANDDLYKDDVTTLTAAASLRSAVSSGHDALIYEVLTGDTQKWEPIIKAEDAKASAALLELDGVRSANAGRSVQLLEFRNRHKELVASRDQVRERLSSGSTCARGTTFCKGKLRAWPKVCCNR